MGNGTKIEDSPFYVDYNQNNQHRKVLSLKLEPDKIKALRRHLIDKHNDNGKLKDKDVSISHHLNMIITKYLQEQCLQMKTFNRSIFAILDMWEFKKNKDSITPLFVAKNIAITNSEKGMIASIVPLVVKNKKHPPRYDYKDELSVYQVHDMPISDFESDGLKELDESLQNMFNKELEQYGLSDNIHVLEIALNNYLDVPHDGVFSCKSDSTIHEGVNFISTDIGIFGVIYQWKVHEDYSIEILNIQVCEQQEIPDLLLNCGNSQLYKWYTHFFMINRKQSSPLEINNLEKECHELQKQIKHKKNMVKSENEHIQELEKELEVKQEHIDQFKPTDTH